MRGTEKKYWEEEEVSNREGRQNKGVQDEQIQKYRFREEEFRTFPFSSLPANLCSGGAASPIPTSSKHSFCFSRQTALRFTSNNSARTKETTHTHTACSQKHTRVVQYRETTHHSVDSAIWSQPKHKQPVNTFLQSIKFLFLSFYLQKKKKRKMQILHTMQMLRRFLSCLKGSCLIVMVILHR